MISDKEIDVSSLTVTQFFLIFFRNKLNEIKENSESFSAESSIKEKEKEDSKIDEIEVQEVKLSIKVSFY